MGTLLFLIGFSLAVLVAGSHLLNRAKARAEQEEALESRLARYAGINRHLG
jgi:hypothetical protein